MLTRLTMPAPREIMKWCAYAVVLIAPGSFLVLLTYAVVRHLHLRMRTN